ncbi:hypothetical protein LguiA_001460 [Lonicera macranthoides]
MGDEKKVNPDQIIPSFVKLRDVKLAYYYIITNSKYLLLTPLLVTISLHLSTYTTKDLFILLNHLKQNLVCTAPQSPPSTDQATTSPALHPGDSATHSALLHSLRQAPTRRPPLRLSVQETYSASGDRYPMYLYTSATPTCNKTEESKSWSCSKVQQNMRIQVF